MPPEVVQKSSLGRFYEKLPSEFCHRNISKYCLLTEKSAITPWHTDFSGTAVFYLLLKGTKEFVVVKPTPENINKFNQYLEGNQ